MALVRLEKVEMMHEDLFRKQHMHNGRKPPHLLYMTSTNESPFILCRPITLTCYNTLAENEYSYEL
jgi:hypothetical protein